MHSLTSSACSFILYARGVVVINISYKRYTAVVLLATLMTLGSVFVYASYIYHGPTIITSEDGSRVFVYNPREYEDYPLMGVYYNTEPLELAYSINLTWLISPYEFYFSSDMRYFVWIPTVSQNTSLEVHADEDLLNHHINNNFNRFRRGSPGIPSRMQATALEFYGDGVLLNSYRIDDLVRNAGMLRYMSSSTVWLDYESIILDTEKNTFTFTTVDELDYVFDITTGKIASNNNSNGIFRSQLYKPFIIGICLVAIFAPLFIMHKQGKKN